MHLSCNPEPGGACKRFSFVMASAFCLPLSRVLSPPRVTVSASSVSFCLPSCWAAPTTALQSSPFVSQLCSPLHASRLRTAVPASRLQSLTPSSGLLCPTPACRRPPLLCNPYIYNVSPSSDCCVRLCLQLAFSCTCVLACICLPALGCMSSLIPYFRHTPQTRYNNVTPSFMDTAKHPAPQRHTAFTANHPDFPHLDYKVASSTGTALRSCFPDSFELQSYKLPQAAAQAARTTFVLQSCQI